MEPGLDLFFAFFKQFNFYGDMFLDVKTLDRQDYSLSPGFWQSFISIEVCRNCIPALASSCKKQLTGFFVGLLFFLKVKRIS